MTPKGRENIKHFAESFVNSIVKDYLKEPSDFFGDIEKAFKVAIAMSQSYLGTSLITVRTPTEEEETFCKQAAEEHVEFLRKLYNFHVASAC